MIQYYLSLLDKPAYQLSSSEQMFVDVFPYIVMAIILFVVFATWYVVAGIKSSIERKKRHANRTRSSSEGRSGEDS